MINIIIHYVNKTKSINIWVNYIVAVCCNYHSLNISYFKVIYSNYIYHYFDNLNIIIYLVIYLIYVLYYFYNIIFINYLVNYLKTLFNYNYNLILLSCSNSIHLVKFIS